MTIPLQAYGVTDVDMTKLTTQELMAWGLTNLWREGEEGGYGIYRGHRLVRDFPDAESDQNFFEKAFPGLFPYGRGGIEANRPVKVDFMHDIRRTLQYHDRRFRVHYSFPFIAFGIWQRRQVLGSARVEMNRRDFERDAQILETITVEALQKAEQEEKRGQMISDPAVKVLFRHLRSSCARVKGSNVERRRWRSNIRSMSIGLNPLSIFATINPPDLHDPIVQILCGEQIDMDLFDNCVGPSKEKRQENVARDPFAAAEYFHFIIRLVIRVLLKVDVTQFCVRSGVGILGEIGGYTGFVESQGRGSLHIHFLLWLKNAPTMTQMAQLLQSPEFRDQIVEYIRQNIRAYLPGLDDRRSLQHIARQSDVAYSRPPNPYLPNYFERRTDFELRFARSKQHHICQVGRCLVVNKHGDLRCKRRAPFPLANQDFIEEDGRWGCKRVYEFMNAWNPSIGVNVRGNNDLKLITNGSDTKNVSHYVATYSAKNQGRNYNLSAIVNRGYAFHQMRDVDYGESLRDKQRRVLITLMSTCNREQELAGPMIISLLMGWGDKYCSHKFTPVFWTSFMNKLLVTFPSLKVYVVIFFFMCWVLFLNLI